RAARGEQARASPVPHLPLPLLLGNKEGNGVRALWGARRPVARVAGEARLRTPTTAVRSHVVPRLVDTSIRVLGQEPLAGVMPTSALIELATLLDGAGFAYLEVSGGGVFDAAVRRGVESPWERIRAIKSHTSTPLAMAVRGRFLVGARP